MSFVLVAPDLVGAASSDLAGIGSAISAAHAAAAVPTTAVAAAAADEVSTAIAALLGEYGQEFQALGAQASAFHADFVQLMSSGSAAYAGTEAASVQQVLLNLVNAPTEALVGRPLIGNGANGATPAPGPPARAGSPPSTGGPGPG